MASHVFTVAVFLWLVSCLVCVVIFVDRSLIRSSLTRITTSSFSELATFSIRLFRWLLP